MTNKLLYNVLIPSSTQRDVGSQRRQNLLTQGVLGQDAGYVNSTSTQPGEQRIQAVFSGQYVELSVEELEQLFNATGFGSIPYCPRDRETSTKVDGYYVASDINVEPLAAQTNDGFRIDGTLIKEGTRRSHWRAIKTSPTTVDSPWVGNPGAEFAISWDAKKVRWLDEVTGVVEDAEPVRARYTEHGAVEIYDADRAPGESPTLIYDLPYQEEYKTDCRVWDDHNRQKELIDPAPGTGPTVGSTQVGSATVGEGETVLSVQWQRVFRTDHEFYGQPVVESGALRLRPDERNGILRAYWWNESDSTWDVRSLGSSSWRLSDFDIREIRPECIKAHVTFRKILEEGGYGTDYGYSYGSTKTTVGDEYTVIMVMQRGLIRARFLQPLNEDDAVPPGLMDRLQPIARIQNRSASEEQGLVPRKEVTR